MSEIGNKNHLDYRFMDVRLGTATGLVRGHGGSEFDWGFGRKQNPADCEDEDMDLVTNFVESLPVFTRASQFEGLSAQSSYRLQRTGGRSLRW